MNQLYRIRGSVHKSLFLFLVMMLGASCAPAATVPTPGSPQESANLPTAAAPSSGPQDGAATAAPGTPTATVPPQPASPEWGDQIVYVLVPQKFYDGDPTNNHMRDQYDLPNSTHQGGFLGGDIAGIRQQMPYLKSLGITSVLLYPVFCNDEAPFFHYLPTGFNVRDHRCIDRNFGTNEEFVQLIEEFHSTANGPRINVILDLPISTTGHEHPWRMNSSYYRPWNYQNPQENIGCSPDYCEPYLLPDGTGVDHSFSMPMLNHTAGIDTGTEPYREIRDTIFWLVDTFDIDGFRYDSAQNFHPAFWVRFLRDFRERYSQTKPNFWHVAEVFVWPQDKKSWQIPSDEFLMEPIRMDSVYDFALAAFIQEVFAKGTDPNCLPFFCESLPRHLEAPGKIESPERLMAPLDGYELDTFLNAVQDGRAKERLALALAFEMTINRIPLIASGIEYGVLYSEPGELFAAGLDQAYHEHFKRLLRIRLDHPAFRWGSITPLDFTTNIISYARQYEGATYIVVLNNAAAGQSFVLDLGARGISCSRGRNLLVENDQNIQFSEASLSITLNAWEPKIIQCE